MKANANDFQKLSSFIENKESGEANFKPIIASSFPFSQEGVNEGFAKLKGRRTVGKIIIEQQMAEAKEAEGTETNPKDTDQVIAETMETKSSAAKEESAAVYETVDDGATDANDTESNLVPESTEDNKEPPKEVDATVEESEIDSNEKETNLVPESSEENQGVSEDVNATVAESEEETNVNKTGAVRECTEERN